jgi:hypothetical protein
MVASRGLLMPAHFIEAGGGGIESLLYLGLLPTQTFLLDEQSAMLGCERRNLGLARKERAVFFAHSTAVNHPLRGNEFSSDGRKGKLAEFPFQTLRLIKIVHEDDST